MVARFPARDASLLKRVWPKWRAIPDLCEPPRQNVCQRAAALLMKTRFVSALKVAAAPPVYPL